jgi:hypothetical protein
MAIAGANLRLNTSEYSLFSENLTLCVKGRNTPFGVSLPLWDRFHGSFSAPARLRKALVHGLSDPW